MWTEYLPYSEMSFVEYNAACAEQYRDAIETKARGKLYIGDQENVIFLKSIIDDQEGKLFDVIIDDGTRVQRPALLRAADKLHRDLLCT